MGLAMEVEFRNRFQLSAISHEYRTNFGRAAAHPCHDYQKTGEGNWDASSLTVLPSKRSSCVPRSWRTTVGLQKVAKSSRSHED